MKKKSIQKLKLKKASVSALNIHTITGGDYDDDIFIQSVNICETIDYSRCYGELECQIYG